MELIQKIAMTIRAYRKAKKIRQEDLARQINCSQVTISNLEAGKNVEINLIARVCEALDLELIVTEKMKQEHI